MPSNLSRDDRADELRVDGDENENANVHTVKRFYLKEQGLARNSSHFSVKLKPLQNDATRSDDKMNLLDAKCYSPRPMAAPFSLSQKPKLLFRPTTVP